uniref:Cytochrome c oxidase subunit 3 n=1 Tax=Pedicinus obtusus TaxID=592408 RepID=A0A7L9CYD5_9NEOP|nr:cytochrome c oxidase subunit 3 [Pedicinus obtusus]
MFMNGFHPFHILSSSPYPLFASLALMVQVLMVVFWLSTSSSSGLISLFVLLVVLFAWWRDVTRESLYQGCHTSKVMKGLQMGMVMFILSEVMFFFSFFFALFFYFLSPDLYSVGGSFPPEGVVKMAWNGIPLLNSILLLSSGVTITWCHYEVLQGKFSKSMYALGLTSLLGVIFLVLQGFEYYECSFTMADGVYGAVFFMMTGFHGLHVIVGTVFILSMLFRMFMGHFSENHHLGFEMAAWYWHFVDVVWLLLFICLYWWV